MPSHVTLLAQVWMMTYTCLFLYHLSLINLKKNLCSVVILSHVASATQYHVLYVYITIMYSSLIYLTWFQNILELGSMQA